MDLINGIRKLIKKQKNNSVKENYLPLFTNEFPEYQKYQIGIYTYGNPTILSWGENANLIIGKFCSVAKNVTIFLGGNHRLDWVTTYPFNSINDCFMSAKDINGHPSTKGDVIIGNDVWIGQGAVIMSGITIGDGAAIGAYSIVTKNVEPYSVVAGNPARKIRYRFDEETIAKLLEICWWNWPIEKINKEVKYLCNTDIESFINRNLPD